MKKDLYVFLGPPGSGKGSLSSLCVKNLGWTQLSTGNMCRREIACGSQTGKRIDLLIKSGKLISDELIVDMIEHALRDSAYNYDSIILDGFPRTALQASAFDTLMAKDPFGSFGVSVVRMCISAEALVNRLANRIVCSNKDCQAVYSKNALLLSSRDASTCDACSAQLIQRVDDEAGVVRNRLEHYYEHERGIIDRLKQKDRTLFDLNVERPLEEVFADFKRVVGVKSE